MIVVQLGDTLLTMVESPSLDLTDEIPYHYTLVFRDLPTGVVEEISADGEQHAVELVAAWLMADSDNLGCLEPRAAQLRGMLQSRKFMP